MKLNKLFKKFRHDEDGAVTVDWVVLTAAVVGLGIAATSLIKTNVATLSSNIAGAVSDANTDLSTERGN